MAMTAVGVTGPYIQGLAQAGYRPASIDTLVEFRALNITPDYIGGFVRAGRAGMDPDDLVTFRAMNITPEIHRGVRADRLPHPLARNIGRIEGAEHHARVRPFGPARPQQRHARQGRRAPQDLGRRD
jgi:hypothetical protein